MAARAGVGKSTVYRWWSSKSALVLEAIDADLTKPPPPSGDVRADIHAVMSTMLDDLRGPQAATLLALGGEMLHDPPADAGPADLFQAGRGAVEDMLEDAARRGISRPTSMPVSCWMSTRARSCTGCCAGARRTA